MIYLIRHGQDDERYVGGHSDIDLIDEGITVSHEVGKWLKEQNLGVSTIYTSDIKRTFTTSTIINEYLGLPIVTLEKLRGLNKGNLNGMLKTEAALQYPDFINLKDINVRYPNGESSIDLYKRIKGLLAEISKYDNSIFVTHRGIVNMFYYILNDITLDMNKERFNVTPNSVHELDIKKLQIRRIK